MTDTLKMAREALAELGAAHAWLAFGECRAYDAVRSGPLLSSAEADAKARAAMAAIDAQQAATPPAVQALTDEQIELAQRIAFGSTNRTQYTEMCKHWYRAGLRDGFGIGAAAQGGEHV